MRTFLIMIIFSASRLFSQGLASHIPSDVQLVISLNFSSINKKVTKEELSKMNFLKSEGVKEQKSKLISTLIQDPTAAGLKLEPYVHIATLDRDTVKGTMVLFTLESKDKFSDLAREYISDSTVKIINGTGFDYIYDGSTAFVWSSDFAIIFLKEDSYRYYYYSEPFTEEEQAEVDSLVNSEIARLDSMPPVVKQEINDEEEDNLSEADIMMMDSLRAIQEAQLAADSLAYVNSSSDSTVAEIDEDDLEYYDEGDEPKGYSTYELREKYRDQIRERKSRKQIIHFFSDLVNTDPEKSILGKKSFRDVMSKSADIIYYAGPEKTLFQNNRNNFRSYVDPADTTDYLADLMQDVYAYGYANFENGEINFSLSQHYNQELLKLLSGMMKGSVPKSFRKYMHGTNLLGYGAVSYDMKKLVEVMEKFMYLAWQEFLGREANLAIGGYQIVKAFVDEDVLYNLIPGQMLFAVTDVRPFVATYVSYEYDEDFNKKEIRREKTENLPEFIFISKTNKKDKMAEILKSVQTMGGLETEGKNIYTMNLPGKYDFKIYVALVKNNLIITNDDNLVKGKFKGYSRKKRIKSEQWKLTRNNSTVVYWDVKNTSKSLAKIPEFSFMPGIANAIGESFEFVQFTGMKTDGVTQTSSGKVKMSDSGKNSLPLMFEIFDRISSQQKIR